MLDTDAVRDFSLNEFAHRQVSELPGGVRKLLDIAMALVENQIFYF